MDGDTERVLEFWVAELQKALQQSLIGVYLVGSIALNGYHLYASDIDFVVVVRRTLSQELTLAIQNVHKKVNRNFPEFVIKGFYVPLDELGKASEALTYYNDRLETGGEGVHALTWFVLAERGVRQYGRKLEDLNIPHPAEDLLSYARGSLTNYWQPWLERCRSKTSSQALFLLQDAGVAYTVLGAARLYYTLMRAHVASKETAGRFALQQLPQAYHPIISESLRIRSGKSEKPIRNKLSRRKMVVDYLDYILSECARL